MGNQLAGADKSVTRSFRASEDLLEEFDEGVESSDYVGHSEAIRAFTRESVGGTSPMTCRRWFCHTRIGWPSLTCGSAGPPT